MALFYRSFVFFIGVFSPILFASDCIDDEINQDFIVETKKIDIPNFPCAFNPSIIRWKGSLLMSFRVRNQKLVSTFEIGLVWLDDQLNLEGPAKILDIRSNSVSKLNKEQDPRLVTVGDDLYIVYSNDIEVVDKGSTVVTRRVFVSKVNFDGLYFSAEPPECLLKFEGERSSRWEKNWVPFDYEGTLLLSYSLSPHRVLKPLFGKGSCETFGISKKTIPWTWGELRGGTPALKLNERQYLAFFHSSLKMASRHSNGNVIPHYVMGAYLFHSFPPFEITHMSPEPIIAKNFYRGLSYNTWRPVTVVFPGGFIFDNEYVWIAYGRQDHEIWLVKLHLEGLLESFKPL
jgi:predicted GH43/DUF377 family glycosyl hydrolase